MELNKVKS